MVMCHMLVDGKFFEVVKEFKYLGVTVYLFEKLSLRVSVHAHTN